MRAVLPLAIVLLAGPAAGGPPDPGPDRVPVLVELFTSQGCSSCPPADAFLDQLARVQPVRRAEIFVVSQHVDYWNDLGWEDPFSSAEFSRRQSAYARRLGAGRVYTPQLVVDGAADVVGSDRAGALRAISRAARGAKAVVRLEPGDAAVEGEVVLALRVEDLPARDADEACDVWLAVTEDGLSTEVSSGENAGKRLTHAAVARALQRVGEIEAGAVGPFAARPTVEIDPGWDRTKLRAVAFVQERTSRRILGVAGLPLAR